MGGCVGPVWSDSLWSPCDPFSTVSSGRVDSHEAVFAPRPAPPWRAGQRQPQRTRPAPQGSRGWRRPWEGAAGPGHGGDAWAALPAPDAAVSSASPRTPRSCDKWEKDPGGGDDGPPGAVAVRPEPSRAVREGWLLPLPRPWGGGGELDFQRNFFGNIKHSDNVSRLRVWHIRLCQTDAVCDGTIVISGRACVAEGAVSGVRMQTCPGHWRAGLGKHRCSGTPAGASAYLKQGALSPSGWGPASRGSFRA